MEGGPASAGASRSAAFARFSWGVLAYTIAVVLWGAYVRATGSGAGCGEHWPLCNGVVVPRAPGVATLIEFTHRLTSGLSLLLIAGLALWGWRVFPARHLGRSGVIASVVLIVSEALIGAGLVLFGLVANDRSPARAISLGMHLTNTFLLLAALAVTGFAASSTDAARIRLRSGRVGPAVAALGACLLVGVSGAITALGDTLFPVASLGAGWAQDIAPGAHLLVRLRVYHPVLALLSALGFLVYAQHLQRAVSPAGAVVGRLARVLLGVVTAQIAAGILNLMLLAPVWLQLFHLLLAEGVWITLVLLTVAAATAEGARG